MESEGTAEERKTGRDSEEDDDDMPDLESVGSSEYTDEEEVGSQPSKEEVKSRDENDGEASPKSKEPSLEQSSPKETSSPSPTGNGSIFKDDYDYSYIAHWRYRYINDSVKEPAKRIKVQLLSPFLFGTFSLADKWINWLHEAGLLSSKSEFNTGELSDRELLAVETVERAANEASPFLDTVPQKERGLFDTLVDAVDPCNTLSEVVKAVGDFKWFNERVNNIKPPWNADKEPPSEHFYVIAFVYAIVITVKKSELCDSDSELTEDQTAKEAEKCRIKGNERYKDDEYKPAIRSYTNAINICPFSHEAYGNRAIAFLKTLDFRSSLSDSYRCIVLNPDGWKGYSRYSCALRALGEEVKAECIHREAQTCFPKDKGALTQEWNKFAEMVPSKSSSKEDRKSSSTPEDSKPVSVGEQKKADKLKKKGKKQEAQKKLNKKLEDIKEHLSRGSLSLRQGDAHTSAEEYERALQLITETKGKWQESVGVDHIRLHNIIIYLSARANFEIGSKKAVEDHLSSIIHNKSLFPACHLLMAQCHMHAHRYKDAERSLYQALTQMPNYSRGYTVMSWPGLREPIEELRPSLLESTIRRLREFCTPKGRPDLICRYHSCNQHHLSSYIYYDDYTNKESIVIICWSGCSLSLHHDCWKKWRDELVVTNDKDLLGKPCLTPSCEGTITEVRILEGPTVRYRNQSNEQREPKKQRIVKTNRQAISSEAHLEKVLKKRLEAKEKKRLISSREVHASVPESQPSTDKTDMVCTDTDVVKSSITQSPQVDSRSGSELLQREQESEDVSDRKDSKQRKAKKKKSKGNDERSNPSNPSATELTSLFTTAPKDGRVMISANDNIDVSGNVVQPEISPDKPFSVPEELKEAHRQFEQDYDRRKASKPPQEVASLPPKSFTDIVQTAPTPKVSSIEKDLFTYFEDVLREHGPLNSSDQNLQDALNHLPDDRKELIEKRNGLDNFMTLSPRVESHQGLLCLKEYSKAVAESIEMEQNRSSSLAKNFVKQPNCVSGVGSQEDGLNWIIGDGVGNGDGVGGRRGSSGVNTPCDQEDVGMFGGMFNEQVSMTSGPPSRVNSYSSQKSRDVNYGSLFTDQTDNSKTAVATQPQVVAKKPPVLKEKGVQTTRIRKVDFAMMTEGISMDNYKQMYENACKERNRLSLKVRNLEDDKVKLKRQHGVEVEKTIKQAKEDAEAEASGKILTLRMQHGDEMRKYEKEKKDKQDQVVAMKKEMKSVQEKLERAKKDVLKFQEELNCQGLSHQRELEHVMKESHVMEERLKVAHSTAQRTRERAVLAELNLVQMERDVKLKELEQLIKEATVVSERTKLPDWKTYGDKLRTTLEEFKAATDHQIHSIQQGTEYASLEKVTPNIPTKPPLPQLVNPAAYMQAQLMLQAQAMKVQAQAQAQAQAQGQLMGLMSGLVPPGMVRPQLPLEQAKGGTQPPVGGASTKLGQSFPVQGGHSPQLKQKRGVQQIWEKISSDYPDLTQEALKDILREVKSENNDSLTHMATDHIVLAVREKLKARAINQLTSSVPMTTTATPTVFPSAFPSQSQLGVSEPGVDVSSTTAPGSVLLPMAQNAAMWSMRPSQPSQTLPSLSVPSSSVGSGPVPQVVGAVQQSKLLQHHHQQMPVTQPTSFPQGYPPGVLQAKPPALQQQPGTVVTAKPDPVLPSSVQPRRVAIAAPPKPRTADHVVYGEDECVICAEDMHHTGVLKLDCGHRFHEHCIRQWLAEQSTCPTCRDHVKLEEDFPELS